MNIVSPFRERIEPLLAMPELGENILEGFDDGSNCHGTSLYVLDVERSLLVGSEPPRGIEHGARNDGFFLPEDASRPGFVGRFFMKRRLNDTRYFEETRKMPYTIVAFFDFREGLSHSGLYLGEYSGRDMIFHQKDIKHPFELSDVDTYASLIWESFIL